ncbi:hypothetical protein ACO0QE_000134 [Hanseniaspora vineae]
MSQPDKEDLRSPQAIPSELLNTPKHEYPETYPEIPKFITFLKERSGLSWPVFIPVSTIIVRTCITFPLSIWQRKRLIKQNELKPIVKAMSPVFKSKLAYSNNVSNHKLSPEQIILLSVKETRKRQKQLFKTCNVSMWKNLVLPLVQFPLWITISYGLRNNPLVLDHDPILTSLNSGLPLSPIVFSSVLGFLSLSNCEMYAKILKLRNHFEISQRSTNLRNSFTNISRFFAMLLTFTSFQQPELLVLYWISSQTYSFVMNLVLNKWWPFEYKLIK